MVKVEPHTGDPGRGPAGHGEYFLVWNSNKRSISINLRNPKGRELLLKLLPNYDVFVENYSPGSIERLNLGYEVMKAVNPGIIYARIKGFGLSGAWSGYKCFDMVAQAAAGAFSITGEPDGPPMRRDRQRVMPEPGSKGSPLRVLRRKKFGELSVLY